MIVSTENSVLITEKPVLKGISHIIRVQNQWTIRFGTTLIHIKKVKVKNPPTHNFNL